MEYQSVLVPLPRSFVVKSKRPERVSYLDIETKKVDVKPFIRETGEKVTKRWEPILIGLGFRFEGQGYVEMTYEWDDWGEWFSGVKNRSDLILYGACRREFDEMILKGRFSNARRAHLPKRPKGFPGVDENLFRWLNVHQYKKLIKSSRDRDIESISVPDKWPKEMDRIIVHNFRDVIEIILMDPGVEVVDLGEVKNLMGNYEFCKKYIADNE